MSARSYRKPRNSKTPSSLAAEAHGERPPLVPASWLLEHRSLWDHSRGEAPPPRPLPLGAHCATLLPDHQALGKAGAPEVVSWASEGAGLAQVPPAAALLFPPAPVGEVPGR